MKNLWGCVGSTAFKTVLVLLLFALSFLGSVAPALSAQRPLIVAHYMPWFEAQPASHRWGWHWKMNAFDPEQKTGDRRQIASHYYPLIGPYDSGDPAVIEYHLLLMKLAGIDGVVVDWYGLSDYLDYPVIQRNTLALFEGATKLGMQVGICYEDQTINRLVEAKRLAVGDRVAQTKREMAWLRSNWFSRQTYLKLDGRPVLLSFGWGGLSETEWEQVFPSKEEAPLYLSEHRRRSVAAGAFDWPQPQMGFASLDTYYRSVKDQPLFMPVAFPRFHDIYKEGKAQEGYPQIPDNQGQTFAMTFARALQSGAPLVQIATWNDWGEGTVIEPSEEFGYRDLEVVQKAAALLRKTHDRGFVAKPEDLRLPYRLWQLRGRAAQEPRRRSELDAVAGLLATGKIAEARSALKRIEAEMRTP